MRAAVRDTYGEADVIQVREVARPVPGEGEVLLRVRAAGMDQGVWHVMSGMPVLARLAFGIRRPKNPALGRDVAGVVEALGPGGTSWAVGDEVFGTSGGAFAEFALCRADRVASKPAGLSFESAAIIPVSGCAALLAVRERVRPGDRVLVLGAAGGVGSFALQLAKHFGAVVTAVCSAEKADLARALGAHDVADYRADTLGGRYDLIVDTGGNRSLRSLRRLLTAEGALVLVGGEGGGRILQGFDRQLRAMALSRFTKQRLIGLISTEAPDDLVALADLAVAGALWPALDRTFSLEETADAMRYLREGRVRGKIAIVP